MVPGLNEKVGQHLNKYLISEQVEIVDRTQDLALYRLVGPRAGDVLDEQFGALTSEYHIRRRKVIGLPGFDIFAPAEHAELLREGLRQANLILASPEVHEVLRIEAGTPEYGKEMDDERFVMEVGRTSQAICYTKGCYLGQEPIVMARDRGQVNRMLLGVKFADSKEPFAPGSKLFAGETEVGQVTSSAWSPRLQRVLALAYLRRGHWQPGIDLICDRRRGVSSSLPFIS